MDFGDQIQEPNERELALIEHNKGPEDEGNLWSNPSNFKAKTEKNSCNVVVFWTSPEYWRFWPGYQGQGVKRFFRQGACQDGGALWFQV